MQQQLGSTPAVFCFLAAAHWQGSVFEENQLLLEEHKPRETHDARSLPPTLIQHSQKKKKKNTTGLGSQRPIPLLCASQASLSYSFSYQ